MAGQELETDDLPHFAVLWPALPDAATDGNGRLRIGNHVDDIPTRWRLGQRSSTAAFNHNVTADATVVVDREIPVGSIMWKGQFANLPSPLKDLYEVIDYRETDDVKGQNKRRVVTVTKFKGVLPNTL